MRLVMTIDPAKTYSAAELAKLLGVSTRQLRRWTTGRRGRQLPKPFKLGRSSYWQGETLLRYIVQRQMEAL
jgi:predicted DNA-binding transcriptional regulator AlpA